MEVQKIDSSKLLKATDVAEILNISRSLSYRIIQAGHIRSVRIGKAKRIRPADLADYITRNLSPTMGKEELP